VRGEEKTKWFFVVKHRMGYIKHSPMWVVWVCVKPDLTIDQTYSVTLKTRLWGGKEKERKWKYISNRGK
jgi:hypothetical protein